jgi:hypothetical protein
MRLTVKRQVSFLSLFFVALSAAFAATVYVRVRAHASTGEHATRPPGIAPAATASDSVSDSQSDVTDQPAADEARASRTGNANGAGASSMATQSSSDASHMSARERRFNELLHSPSPGGPAASPVQTAVAVPRTQAPPPPPAPPKPQQSTLSRLLTPVVNALTGGNSATTQQPNRPRDTGPGNGSRDQPPRNDKDPTSDTTPPQLVGVQFDPPAIHDGEDTMLTVVATDDLSGIRNISGSITSPTGKALQGFALQSAGDGTRWGGRITVPKDAEEGLWHINFLSLTDNASNTQNINFSQGTLPPTAQFRVTSSRPDSTPPTLKAVWLDKPAISNGEKVTVFVTAVDDKSGTNLVSGVFQSPSKFARIGFGCRPGDGDTWTCDMTPPKCSDCGNWQLEQIQLQDKAGNMATIRSDNPIVAGVRLNVNGQSCDSTPPQMSTLVIDPTAVSNVEISTVNLTATVSDDICGVASVSGQAAGPAAAGAQPPRIYFSFSPASEGQWTGHLTVPKLAAKGTWSIVWVQVLDKGNNLKTYSQSDPVLANAKFVVH